MAWVTGLDFTGNPELFRHLQNRGEELLVSAGRKIMRSVRFPFVTIVTCDRAEILSFDGAVPHETLEKALSVSPIAASRFRYSISGDEALLHVFMLSSGIISPLFGEDTIIGQMTEAASCARIIGSSSPRLDKLLGMAASFSRRMHSAMNLRVFDRTIADEVAERVSGISDVLIVGSGEAARLLASVLLPSHRVTMTLRDPSKTYLVPPGAVPAPYDERMRCALCSDAVISASSGLYHTFTEEEALQLQGKMLFDLSSPPDLPLSVPAVRVSDLGVPEPEKEAAVNAVTEAAWDEISRFSDWCRRSEEAGSIEVEAEAVAYESMRRLSGMISSLPLSPETEKALRLSVIDSVRKACISRGFGKKRGKPDSRMVQ